MQAIFVKTAKVLEEHLRDEEFVKLGEAMDNDPNNALLEAVNKRLAKSHPEIFGSGTKTKKKAKTVYVRKTRDVVCQRCGVKTRVPAGGSLKNYVCAAKNKKDRMSGRLTICSGQFRLMKKENRHVRDR